MMTVAVFGGTGKTGSRVLTGLLGGGLSAQQDRPKAPDRMIKFLLHRLAGQVLADAEGHQVEDRTFVRQMPFVSA
jgi:hypothetical protein